MGGPLVRSEPLRQLAAWRTFVDALFETDWVVYL
jgi:hypothetical protein